MKYKWRQQGDEVEDLQRALMQQGFKLPKYGADGDLGGETWGAVEKYAGVDFFSTKNPLPKAITDKILAGGIAQSIVPPAGHVRVEGDPHDVKGYRPWSVIDTIVLHQTGIFMRDDPERFRTLDAHIGILRDHETPIVQTQDLTAYMHHANELNRPSIGIEVNGHFPGVVSRFDPDKHTAEGPTPRQIEQSREAVAWLCDTAEANGGKIRRILPHRVSNDTRRSDPGEVAWREIGVWAIDCYGLSDDGPGFTIGDGTPIPYAWCPKPNYREFGY